MEKLIHKFSGGQFSQEDYVNVKPATVCVVDFFHGHNIRSCPYV